MKKTKINTVIDIILVLVMIPIFFLKGEWHETMAYVLAGLVVVHIVMHWQQFTVMYRHLMPKMWLRRVVTAALLVLIVASFMLPGYLPGGEGPRDGHGRPPGQLQNQSQN